MSQIIYCIPVTTKDWRTFASKLKQTSKERFVLTEHSIFDEKLNCFHEILLDPFSSKVATAFCMTPSVSDEEGLIGRLMGHSCVLYVLTDPDNMTSSIDVVDVLLATGGLAIKNEITGVSFTKEQWRQLAERKNHTDFVNYFIGFLQDEDALYTVGMNQFNLPDLQIETNDPGEETGTLLYGIVENYFTTGTIDFWQGSQFEKQSDFRFPEDDISYNSEGLLIIRS